MIFILRAAVQGDKEVSLPQLSATNEFRWPTHIIAAVKVTEAGNLDVITDYLSLSLSLQCPSIFSVGPSTWRTVTPKHLFCHLVCLIFCDNIIKVSLSQQKQSCSNTNGWLVDDGTERAMYY